MKIVNIITIVIICISMLASVSMLIYGNIKKFRIKKRRDKKLGYSSLGDQRQLNIIRSKGRKCVETGCLPSVYGVVFTKHISLNSSKKFVKFIMKMCKSDMKKKNYYHKHVQEDLNATTRINLQLATYKSKNKEEFPND